MSDALHQSTLDLDLLTDLFWSDELSGMPHRVLVTLLAEIDPLLAVEVLAVEPAAPRAYLYPH